MSLNLSAPTVVAFKEIPASRQHSSAHCAYSCQLHLPVLAKCKIPPSTARSKNCGKTWAGSYVYVVVENLSATPSTFWPSSERLIMASMKLGRSGPNTQETRTTRCPSSAASTLLSPANFDWP